MSDQRRDALKIIGTIGATCAFPFAADELYAQHEHSHAAGDAVKLPDPSYFSKADFETVALIAECIIPATDTPGAIGAGVPAYIDWVVGRNESQQATFKKGLDWLNRKTEPKSFKELNGAERLAILQPLCEAVDRKQAKSDGEKFFAAMKALTADGYWTSKPGMAQTLGFKGGAILASYPVCHEH